MGELSGPADRGQLLVITALSLAVLLSVLTLSLNTAVFAGVHAAQTDDGLRAERGALQYQDAVRRGVAGAVPRINGLYVEYDALRDGLGAATRNWSALTAREYARDGVATNASVTDVAYRTRIVQNASGQFTDQSGNTSWTVAGNVSDARGYDVNVTRASLAQTSNCTGGNGCFALAVTDDGGDAWRLYLANDTDRVELTVRYDGNTTTCDASASSVRVNVTDGTFDPGGPDQCSFPSFRTAAGFDPPYTLTYANAHNASGTYNLTVDGRIVDGSIAADGRYGTTGSPRLDPRIVAANVTVRYRSADLTYGTEMRVVPGESDD